MMDASDDHHMMIANDKMDHHLCSYDSFLNHMILEVKITIYIHDAFMMCHDAFMMCHD